MSLRLLAAAAVSALVVSAPAFAGVVPQDKLPAAGGATAPPAAGQPKNAPKPPAPPTAEELKCQKEVADALKKQRETGQYRMETDMLSNQGPMKMIVEFDLPDRMRQTISLVVNPQPVETIVIGSKAWSNAGEGWGELSPSVAGQYVDQLNQAMADEETNAALWICLGKTTVDGQELIAYQGKEDKPKDVSPGGPQAPENEAARYMYIDAKTGLPVKGIFARKTALDKPFFKAVYTYPDDIKIEKPELKPEQ